MTDNRITNLRITNHELSISVRHICAIEICMTTPHPSDIIVSSPTTVECGTKTYRAVIGKSGLTDNKIEGDGATPRGVFPLRHVYFRADRIAPPKTGLPLIAITRNDGWCDDANHPAYNTPVQLPFTASHEAMWRGDHVYDIVLVLGYNDAPIIQGKGSAIFMHLAQPDWSRTEGCVAVDESSLREILAQLTHHSRIHIR